MELVYLDEEAFISEADFAAIKPGAIINVKSGEIEDLIQPIPPVPKTSPAFYFPI